MTPAKRGRADAAALPDALEPEPKVKPAAPMLNSAFLDSGAELVPVEFAECPCPGTPHPDGDTIWFKPELDVPSGFAFSGAFAELAVDERGLTVEQALGMSYLIAGIAKWTFLDGAGKPIPATRAMIERLKWSPAVSDVANLAARRYGQDALLPLVGRAQRRSLNGRTGNLTLAKKPSSTRRRKRS
jgi:hypothetical protein